MTRRDWWLGILALVLVILVHAAVPRYEWRQGPSSLHMIRIDRWTGQGRIGRFEWDRWKTFGQIHDEAAKRTAEDAKRTAEAAKRTTAEIDKFLKDVELDVSGVPKADVKK